MFFGEKKIHHHFLFFMDDLQEIENLLITELKKNFLLKKIVMNSSTA